MVINRSALIIGAILGFLIAVLAGLWEEKMAKEKKDWIVSISILGGIAFVFIAFFAIGAIAPYDDLTDILRNVIIAALVTFVPFRRFKIWKNIFASGIKNTIDDEHKEDGESQEIWTCDECGAVVEASAIKCPNCGAVFED